MNMLFRVIYAAHANGTHHKLALDALRDLHSGHAAAWRRLFLKHAELYLEGSKAPDKEFKDFKNHVLNVRDNYWGGAPEKAESWYQTLVRELQQENWEQAVWCAGVLSHYYTDPLHPFHTAQCEAESNIHRAVEWSIAKSYGDLRKRGLRYEIPDIPQTHNQTWLKDMIIAGAELANCNYETLIAGYNFEVGVIDPPAGLDIACRNIIGRLIVYASSSFAHVLDCAFEESGAIPPEVPLTMETVIRSLKAPLKWIENKMENAGEVRILKQMYDEYQMTGRVDLTLSEDDRIIRDLHAVEVLAPLAAEREAQRAERSARSPRPQGNFFHINKAAQNTTETIKEPKSPTAQDLYTKTKIDTPSSDYEDKIVDLSKSGVGAQQSSTSAKRPYLELLDDVEAAPSIGSKTAKRLSVVGISTVQDLLNADPDELADKLNSRYVSYQTILDWQDQSRLMIAIAGLRVAHSQLCVGADYRTAEAIAQADPAEMNSAILRFASTKAGQRILGSGKPPGLNAIEDWIRTLSEDIAA